MQAGRAGGEMQRLSLRFLDAGLEARYQRTEGREGRNGFRLTAGASVVLWAAAAILVPLGTDLPAAVASPISALMSLISLAIVLATPWAATLDRQHALVALLTAANGLVILTLASIAGAVAGYAVSAIMLLFAYAFVSRTRFVFAALRTIVLGVGFFTVVLTYRGPGTLLIDSFIFVAAAAGTLLALRRMELARRRVYHQQLVITEQAAALEEEKEKSDHLLLNVLPEPIVARLREGESMIADDYPSVSILFADVVNFTPLASKLSASAIISLLGELFTSFDHLVGERGLEKIKTIGDAYMVAGGLTDPLDDHALRSVDLGLAMQREVERRAPEWGGLAVRIGVHTGPVAGGVIGHHKFAFDLWGDTVNVASRLEELGVPGAVHVSETTWRLVSERFAAESLGPSQLRGLGTMKTFLITESRSEADEAAPTPATPLAEPQLP